MSQESAVIPRSVSVLSFACLLSALACAGAAPSSSTVLVEAGPQDRVHTVLSFPWVHTGNPWILVAPDGTQVPLQIENGIAFFIEPELRRGGLRRYALQRSAGVPPREVPCTVDTTDDRLLLRNGARPALAFTLGSGRLPRPDIDEAYRRAGYLHPVWTPSGRVVTDDYPANHLHHHGFWWAWTRTEFEGRQPDFWNMGQKRGRVDLDQVESVLQGPVFAGFTARLHYTDLLATPDREVLRETWTVRLYSGTPGQRAFVFDLESSQHCATDKPLILPKYHYGGLGYRGPWDWNGPDNVRYLDSLGATNRIAANETRPRWCWMGGQVNGQLAGVAVLDHPGNFRSPQPVRVHPTEPYMSWAPSQLGDWAIRPGETYRSQYRILSLDGEPDPAELDRRWEDFAHPPRVRIEE